MDNHLIDTIEEIKETGQQRDAVRRIMDLPRYTPEQIILYARREVMAYLKKLEDVTFTEEMVASIKAILRQPANTPEEAQQMSADLQSLVEDFFEEELEIGDLNPMYTFRWYMSLMTEEDFISSMNTINHIYMKFVQARSTWIHQQVQAVQVELKDDYVAEKEFEEQTKDYEFANDTVGES